MWGHLSVGVWVARVSVVAAAVGVSRVAGLACCTPQWHRNDSVRKRGGGCEPCARLVGSRAMRVRALSRGGKEKKGEECARDTGAPTRGGATERHAVAAAAAQKKRRETAGPGRGAASVHCSPPKPGWCEGCPRRCGGGCRDGSRRCGGCPRGLGLLPSSRISMTSGSFFMAMPATAPAPAPALRFAEGSRFMPGPGAVRAPYAAAAAPAPRAYAACAAVVAGRRCLPGGPAYPVGATALAADAALGARVDPW